LATKQDTMNGKLRLYVYIFRYVRHQNVARAHNNVKMGGD